MKKVVDITFEKFNIEIDLEKQRNLFKECFPENKGTSIESKEHYFWKFHSFPSFPNSYEYVAKINDNIIGYYAALPYQYIINNKNYTIGMVCDVMTGIKARGKGVFTKLGLSSTNMMKNEELAFTTGYPIRHEVIPGHIKAGWDKVFDLPLYISFLKVNGVFRKKSIEWLSFLPNVLLKLFNKFIFSSKIYLPFDYKIFSSKQIDDIKGIELFLSKWSKEKPIVLNKSRDFLKWRLGAPAKQYEIIILYKNEVIVGVAIVTKVIKEGIDSLAILDFMVLNNSKYFTSKLNSIILKVARQNKCEVILKMMSKYEAKKLGFNKIGYLKSPFTFTLIIKLFDNDIDKSFLYDEKNWSLSWIDSDDL